jgi:predicted ATPase
LLGLATREPVLLVLEDAHWIDPTTLDSIEQGLDRIGAARVMMLLTCRPDGEPPLAGHPHITRLTLNRLSRPAVEAITTRVAGVRRLSAQLRAEIASRTDGVPLFVEELTKAIVEMSQSREGGTRDLWPVGDVPATLHDSLMARLDRVPEVKRVAQLAACIGREFDYRTLLFVAELPEAKLESALELLSGAELVFRRGRPPDATYTFKHALVRDAAANSLLLSERRRVHAAILTALESADTPPPPELLAQHAEAAGIGDAAVERWLAAGRAAVARYANREAVSHFERGLRLVLGQAEGEARDRKELEVLLALGVPQIAARGYASADVERTYARARTLCQHLGESEPLFFVLRGLWNCVFDRADLAQSLEIAELLLTLASRRADPEALALAHRALGTTRLNRGEFEAALDSFRQAMAACSDLGENAGVGTYGEAPYIISWVYSGWVLAILGRLDEGRRAGEAALAAAHRCGNPLIICFTSELMCHILIARREPQACVEVAEAGRKLAEEHLLVFWMAGLTNLLGWGLAHSGCLEDGIGRMRDGIAAWKATGAALHLPTWNAWLAEALLQADAADDAGAAIDESIDMAQRNGDVVMLSVLHRLKAQVLRRAGRLHEAEEHLVEAAAIAVRQQAKLFELQAARDLARLWAERGERRRAYDLLHPVYAAMPDSGDATDLVETRKLLEMLAA